MGWLPNRLPAACGLALERGVSLSVLAVAWLKRVILPGRRRCGVKIGAAGPPLPGSPAAPGAAARASAGRCRLMLRRGRVRPGGLWPRAFADAVAPWRAGPRKRG